MFTMLIGMEGDVVLRAIGAGVGENARPVQPIAAIKTLTRASHQSRAKLLREKRVVRRAAAPGRMNSTVR